MRIVFFGTPAFAATSLRALLHAGHEVVGVVSQPDRPQGRSRSVLVPPPVKLDAERSGIPVLQPDRPTGDLFMAALRRFEPEIGIVVAYGHILRPEVLALPRRGMVNVHASLLPRLRGAAPVQWAIARGEHETGVSIMQMDEGMDSGPVHLRVSTPITDRDTGGTLGERLAELGARALLEALSTLGRDGSTPEPQDHAQATHAPKITRETARVDWQLPAEVVARRIRAFDPVPGAWSVLDGAEVKLFEARPVEGSAPPGSVLRSDTELVVAAGSGAVAIGSVQPSGRKRLTAESWARGHGAGQARQFA